MNKIVIVGLVAGLLCVSMVTAGFREVKCDEGRFNSDICRDHELQDEFDELAHRDRDIEKVNDDQQEEIDYNFLVDGKQKKQIKKLKQEDKTINQIITDNNQAWLKDTRGTTLGRVVNYLQEKYLPSLYDYFVSKAEHEALQQRADRLEARLMILEQGSSIDLDCANAIVTARRLGQTFTVNDQTFNPNDEIGCVSFK